MDPLIRLAGIGKTFPRTQQAGERMRALWNVLLGRSEGEGSVVLEDIDLVVKPGESMGIIGENGAGKSTLLKVITGVLRPSAGSFEVNASIAALLELGAGFQPDFTGMENIRMQAALLGLGKRRLEHKLADILEFADIGEYIHEPVKHYSSGMVVRLGFAIITVINPQLLVTDEILSVGDESFQKKCIRWIERYLAKGGTLLMVSHNMYQVQKLCQHACWIHDGRIRMQGDVFRVTQSYLAYHEEKSARERQYRKQRPAAGLYQISQLSVSGANESEPAVWAFGSDILAEVELQSPDGRPPVVLFGIVRADGTPVYGISSDQAGAMPQKVGDSEFRYSIKFSRPALLPGNYCFRAHAMDPEGLRLFDTREQQFTVTGTSRELGFVRLEHDWGSIDGE